MAEGFIRFSHLGLSSKQLKDRLSAVKVNAAIDTQMKNIWIRAGRVFVESLAAEILVETGESFGSLIPLARHTGATINLPISISKRVRPQLDPSTGIPESGTQRSRLTGISRGVGAFKFQNTPGRFTFIFDFNVFQFALHDAGAGKGGPTSAAGAAARARDAAEKFARNAFQEEVGQIVSDWLTTGVVKSLEI